MKLKLLISSALLLLVPINAEPYLFKKFPALADKIAHITLCDLPTPVQKLEHFGAHCGCENIFIKRDDLTGGIADDGSKLYGGNKPRKLEFLLADALDKKAETIITFGCAGSNHALATAVYAQKMGLKSILLLKDQPNSYVVRNNLLLDFVCDAQLKYFATLQARADAAQEIMANDPRAYQIPTGGSNEIGALGFVNAAMELAEQINMQKMPEPELIYVATGSCGTTAGLVLGLKAAGLHSKVVAVTTENEGRQDRFLNRIKELFENTNRILHDLDNSFEIFEFPYEQLTINKSFCGARYGLYTTQAVEAIKAFAQDEQIALEGTYSAKAVAALMDDAAQGLLEGKTVLFWNTYCGLDFSSRTKDVDYQKLPEEFHRYFTQDVQLLAI